MLAAAPKIEKPKRAKKSKKAKGRAPTTEEFQKIRRAVPVIVGEDIMAAHDRRIVVVWLTPESEQSGSRFFEVLEARTDERVATAQVMVQEIERRAQREGIEPQADLRQFHGHRVEVHAVDAAFENVALEQVDVGQLRRVHSDALLPQRIKDALAGAVQGKVHRVDGKLVQELQQAVGNEIDDFNEEVTTAHCGVQHAQVKETFHQVLVSVVRLQSGPLAQVQFAAANISRRVRLRLLKLVVKRLADLPEVAPHGFELLVEHRAVWIGARSFDTTHWVCLDIDADREPTEKKRVEWRPPQRAQSTKRRSRRANSSAIAPFAERCRQVEQALRRLGIDPRSPSQVLTLPSPSGGRHTYVFFDHSVLLEDIKQLLQQAGLRFAKGKIEFYPSPSQGLRLPFGEGQHNDPLAWRRFIDDYQRGRTRRHTLHCLREHLAQYRRQQLTASPACGHAN